MWKALERENVFLLTSKYPSERDSNNHIANFPQHFPLNFNLLSPHEPSILVFVDFIFLYWNFTTTFYIVINFFGVENFRLATPIQTATSMSFTVRLFSTFPHFLKTRKFVTKQWFEAMRTIFSDYWHFQVRIMRTFTKRDNLNHLWCTLTRNDNMKRFNSPTKKRFIYFLLHRHFSPLQTEPCCTTTGKLMQT